MKAPLVTEEQRAAESRALLQIPDDADDVAFAAALTDVLRRSGLSRGDFNAKTGEIGRALTLERLRRLHDFESVSDRKAERLIHVGQQRLDLDVHPTPDADHQLCQATRFGAAREQ